MRIDKLDGWRFWAVSSVIISHLITHSTYSTVLDSMVRIGGLGLLGVEVFFFISGFVICTVLLKELKTNGRFSIKAFYIRRCFRILPPLWIYLLVILAAASFGVIEFNSEEAWVAVLFVSNFNEMFPVHWYVGHTWSLSYEEQFYIVFPLVLWFVYRTNKTNIFPFLIILFPIMSLLCYFFHMEIAAGFFRFFNFMLWGVVFALNRKWVEKKLSSMGGVFPVVLCLMMILISILPVDKYTTALAVLLLPPIVAITVMVTVFNESAMDRFLEHRGICYLGRVSYGVYLWQQVATGSYNNAGLLFYSLALLIMLAYVVFQYEFIEKRLIRIGSKVSKRIIDKEYTATLTVHAGDSR